MTTAQRQWLEAAGSVEHERYAGTSVLFLHEQKTFLGVQGEVELSVPLDEVEIEELYIRFLLTEKTPAQWNDWEDLIVSLGSRFGFKIMGPDDYLLPCLDFFALLTNNESFRMLCTFGDLLGHATSRSTRRQRLRIFCGTAPRATPA
jgi:hypothetical protein